MSSTPDLPSAKWVKSSYSNGDGGNCIEWSPTAISDLIPVRDSKNPHGPALFFTPDAWSTFVQAAKVGAFER